MRTTIELADIARDGPACLDLMQRNWDETGFDFELRPDFDRYAQLQAAGLTFALAARAEGEIVGYCSVTMVSHPFNPAVICAANDTLFVAPEHRGLTAGRLIKAAEDEARRRGAHRMLWHTRAGTPLAAVLQRHGYTAVDVVVMKGL